MDEKEPLEVQVARIDANVKTILEITPLIRKHDKELYVLKVLAAPASLLMVGWLAQKLGIQIF
jgi:hypothetical protein